MLVKVLSAPFPPFTLLAYRKRLHHRCLASIFVFHIGACVEILGLFLCATLASETNGSKKMPCLVRFHARFLGWRGGVHIGSVTWEHDS